MATEKKRKLKTYDDVSDIRLAPWSQDRKTRDTSKDKKDAFQPEPLKRPSGTEEEQSIDQLIYSENICLRSLSPPNSDDSLSPFDKLDIVGIADEKTDHQRFSSDSDDSKYVRESDNEWECDDLCEVAKRGKLKLDSKHSKKMRLKARYEPRGRMKRTGKYERESDNDEWESDDLCEVAERGKLKLDSKHSTKMHEKARYEPRGRRMKRTGTGKKDVQTLLKMLYLVYNKLVSLCINIASVYATTTPNTAKGPILLCLTTKKCRHIPKWFKRFSTIQKPFYPKPTQSESHINEMVQCDSKSYKEIDETIAFHAESLMMKHKNLEAIKMGLVRSSKNNVLHEPGIVLVCRCKSYIPIDEPYFPSKLQHPSSKTFYHTDVREGYFRLSSSYLTSTACEWNKELAMGCSIGPENGGVSASLGPFVNIKETNELCFLTVRHLFQPLDLPDIRFLGINVVQPADSDFVSRHQMPSNDRRCGTVKVAEISNNIDAALVEINPTRAPSRGYFVGIRPGDLDDTGFASSCFPSYDDGCVKDARRFHGHDYAHDRVIKFGKQTGLTKGAIQTRNMAVRLRDEMGIIQCGSRMQRRYMVQQLQIDSFARTTFFEKGDSGSAVFSVDKTNKLFCIGMAIGVMSDKTCIVTPIQTILERLGQKLRRTLELKAFPSENMEF